VIFPETVREDDVVIKQKGDILKEERKYTSSKTHTNTHTHTHTHTQTAMTAKLD
jgi:hypothetical protein